MRLRGARPRAALAGGSALAALAALAFSAPSCTDSFDALFTHDCSVCLNDAKTLCDKEGPELIPGCLYCRECKDECAGLGLCAGASAAMESSGSAGTGP
jgi:hypothetical protein